jgi:hypothetical protein
MMRVKYDKAVHYAHRLDASVTSKLPAVIVFWIVSMVRVNPGVITGASELYCVKVWAG